MKKQFLSLLAAGLMLGTTPHITAGPELLFGALTATIAGIAHLRSMQMNNIATHVQEQKTLTTMFNNNVLPKKPTFISLDAQGTNLLAIKTERIDTEWVWQVFHLPKGLPLLGNTQDNGLKILQEPVLTSSYGERYDNYLQRFNKARTDLINRAAQIVHGNVPDIKI
jgi:hypothetical protein